MPDGTTTKILNTEQLVGKYIQLRDKIKEIKDGHKRELERYLDVQSRLELSLLEALDRAGAENMRTKAGTVYKAVQTSAAVRDWNQTLAYIQTHELWDLLERRVSKVAALAVTEERGEPIPGVELTQVTGLHVRRAG